VPKTPLPALLLLLALTPPLPGQAPAASPFRQLIEQLGDRDYSRRRQAEERLRAVGPPALPALKEALNHRDAEVRRRVRGLVPALEAQALLAPQRVTLKLADCPVSEALDQIARQTGYQIDVNAAPTGACSFDLKDVTFWEALDHVGRDAGLVVQPGRSLPQVRLEKRPGYAAHVCRDGAFRFTADSVQLYKELEFGLSGPAAEAPRRSEMLTLTLTVFAEPKLPIVGVGEPRLSAASDTDKRSMLLAPEEGEGAGPRLRLSRYGNTGPCYSDRFRVRLRRPSATATGIAVLRGTLPLTLLVEQKPAVVNDLLSAKGKGGRAGSTSFRVERVEALPGNRVRVELTVKNEKTGDGPEPDFAWAYFLAQRVEVQDEKGVAFYRWRAGTRVDASPVRLDLTFGPDTGTKVGQPSKLIFHDWTTREHLAAFEFKELPLP
jgi:hypothetical protein